MLLVSDALMAAHLTSLSDALSAGTGPGRLLLYAGTKPARGAAITSQVLLGQIDLPDPVGTVSGSELTASNVSPLAIIADGTAAWARLTDSAGAFVADLSVGLTGSGADLELSRVAGLQAGGYLDWTGFVIRYPTA